VGAGRVFLSCTGRPRSVGGSGTTRPLYTDVDRARNLDHVDAGSAELPTWSPLGSARLAMTLPVESWASISTTSSLESGVAVQAMYRPFPIVASWCSPSAVTTSTQAVLAGA